MQLVQGAVFLAWSHKSVHLERLFLSILCHYGSPLPRMGAVWVAREVNDESRRLNFIISCRQGRQSTFGRKEGAYVCLWHALLLRTFTRERTAGVIEKALLAGIALKSCFPLIKIFMLNAVELEGRYKRP